MPLAFDAAVFGTVDSNTTLTFAHTCTGSNLILFVGVWCNTGADHVTGITYNGVSMTRVPSGFVANGTDTAVWLYYLINPATGANNVVVSTDTSLNIRSDAASYTGAKQSAQPDNSGNDAPSTTNIATVSLTPVADKCWMVSFAGNNQQLVSADAGTTLRASGSVTAIGDNNAAITPAASTSMAWKGGAGTPNWSLIKASIAPVPAAVVASRGYAFII